MSNRLLIAVCSLFLTFTPTFADTFTVATVDVNKIINDLPESKQKKAELAKLEKKIRENLTTERAKITQLEKKFKASGSNPNSKDALTLRQAVQDYEKKANTANADLREKFLSANKVLTQRVLNVIERYAKKNDISLVIDKNSQGTSPLLYGDEGVDITNIIAKEVSR